MPGRNADSHMRQRNRSKLRMRRNPCEWHPDKPALIVRVFRVFKTLQDFIVSEVVSISSFKAGEAQSVGKR
ncbi:MAG: hypothetical protein KAT56_03300, partial [Sedimentisphaerales bacterium]|nr:hypothetical protein [Sedimentisphaerales bacterium]